MRELRERAREARDRKREERNQRAYKPTLTASNLVKAINLLKDKYLMFGVDTGMMMPEGVAPWGNVTTKRKSFPDGHIEETRIYDGGFKEVRYLSAEEVRMKYGPNYAPSPLRCPCGDPNCLDNFYVEVVGTS